ncbi:ThiF family adenylyltransferase [Corynebacterium lizhenjunii]|uniref:ThiF family adenylyltransferase n=1 Tax=Corynebacterium lizhenjunii TaxID=2709394 RepID=A0A7T0KEE0_9CORY|nr:ThiF family adenylyltransferase [Corynebacterium lizhenjunii]QPK79268.1 ThiF family adenylyltransferase [Corynebacterium lizhenjunii]
MSIRYARQEALWGEEGQEKLRRATVAVIGAGGLGSPALLYLAGAGIGKLLLFDDDTVSLSNLQRQVVHTTAAVGTGKAESAAATIAQLNPEVEVVCLGRLEAATALEHLREADVLLDGTDNFPARYLCSWACHELGIPHVWASILGFDAQLSVFWSGHGPVYEDVFPTMPAPGSVPSCSQAGVLGPVVGTVGSAMALEALKIITGTGTPLVGTLGYFDALAGTWEYIPLSRNGAVPARPDDAPETRHVPVGWRLIDVRTAGERAQAHIPGSEHFPLDHLLAGHNPDLDPNEPAVIHCASGVRSAQAVEVLRQRGYSRVLSLRGGINAWLEQQHSSQADV